QQELETQVKHLTTQVLEKQTQLDEVLSSKNEMRISLNNAMSRIEELNQQLQYSKNSYYTDIESHGSGSHAPMSSSANVSSGTGITTITSSRVPFFKGSFLTSKHSSFSKSSSLMLRSDGHWWAFILQCLDQIGVKFYLLLRTSQWVRIIIIAYLIIIHLWIFILIFSHHNILELQEHKHIGPQQSNSIG
ncbi:hypothetical protein RFI_33563, partial [Reticulomyxa filosa]